MIDSSNSVVVYNIKGGVGKTTISVQLARLLGFTYVTNDSHTKAYERMPDDGGFLVGENLPEIPFENDIVYDFGGFKDPRINKIIAESKCVVIPTLDSPFDVEASIDTVDSVYRINQNIIFAINGVKADYSNKENPFSNSDDLIEFYKETFIKRGIEVDDIRFVKIHVAAALKETGYDCLSVKEKCGNDKLKLHIYRKTIADLDTLVDVINIQNN